MRVRLCVCKVERLSEFATNRSDLPFLFLFLFCLFICLFKFTPVIRFHIIDGCECLQLMSNGSSISFAKNVW